MDMRREFTANVSHELKTPLTSISGYAEIMKDGLVKSADVPRFANNIYTEAQRLITLVEVSKIEIAILAALEQTPPELYADIVNKGIYLAGGGQKCGFHGYREFIYEYKQSLAPGPEENIPNFEVSEFNTYQELLNKSNALLDKAQITRITNLLVSKPRVYVYGRGSSGLVAQEMKLRFMRIGLNIEAVTDSHIMKVNSVILDENCLVIGISVSGQTDDIISSLKAAHQHGAYTLLMTARQDKSYQDFCDETLIFASMEHLEYGNIISPQFPILLVLDVLYAHYLQIDRSKKEALHEYTIQTLQPFLIK